jgi:hypothetical protein
VSEAIPLSQDHAQAEKRKMTHRIDEIENTPTDRELAERLYRHIEHGDEKHRAWLKTELDKFFDAEDRARLRSPAPDALGPMARPDTNTPTRWNGVYHEEVSPAPDDAAIAAKIAEEVTRSVGVTWAVCGVDEHGVPSVIIKKQYLDTLLSALTTAHREIEKLKAECMTQSVRLANQTVAIDHYQRERDTAYRERDEMRERCAKIAEECRSYDDSVHDSAGVMRTGRRIATAIRALPPTAPAKREETKE